MKSKYNAGEPGESIDDILEEVRQVIEGRNFASLDEANAFLEEYMRKRNQQPLAAFHGLSAEQMFHFLHMPFDSPHLVTFTPAPEGALSAPIMRLFSLLLPEIPEKGLKATAKGNLPRQVVRNIALSYWGEEKYEEKTKDFQLNTELDFFHLHVTKIIAELAGFLRKREGKLFVTKKCRTLLDREGMAGIYLPLFRTLAWKFNWGYYHISIQLAIVQQSFLFTLYLLHRYGERWRDTSFYKDAFLEAYPHAVMEIGDRPNLGSAEKIVRTLYEARALTFFCDLAGLAEWRSIGEVMERKCEIRKTALLDAFVHFKPDIAKQDMRPS
ncbi:MAG TPA: hypothetical protein GXX29_06100 [Firmicutes bacterium]|nr:hypothetical protein [Bacillota bacterium]